MPAHHDYNDAPSDGLSELVAQYEQQQAAGRFRYWDLDDYIDVVEFYEQNFQPEKALAVVENALSQYSFSAQLYIKQAQLLLDLGHYDQANAALDKAHSYEPDALDILLTRVEIYNRLGYYDEGHELLEQARQQLPDEDETQLDILLLEAALWESEQHYAWAFDNLRQILQKDADYEPASVRMRLLLEQLDAASISELLPYLQKQTDDFPFSAWAWTHLGFAFGKLNRLDDALEAFDYAVVINEEFAFARYDAVELLMNHDRFHESIKMLQECLDIFGPHAETYLRLGEAHYELKNHQEAMACYEKAVKLDHLNGRVWQAMGEICLDTDQSQKALQLFTSAHKADKSNPDFAFSVAMAYAALCQLQPAHDYYQKAIALAIDDVDYWLGYLEFLIDESLYQLGFVLISTAREQLNSHLLDYAEATLLILAGKRQEGFMLLMQSLHSHYDDHQLVFDLSPELAKDAAVMEWIDLFAQQR